MSLKYIYNQLELSRGFTERDRTFIEYLKRLDYPEGTIDTLVSWLNEKNPTGLLLFDCNTVKLLRLLPKYMVELMTPNVMDSFISQQYFKVFDKIDQKIIRHTTTLYNVIKDSSTANRIFPLEGIKKELLNEPELNMNDVFECFMFGPDKYSDWDFIKLNPNILVPSFFRHYYKHYYVSKTDEESGLPHIAHSFCNVLMIEHILQGKRR